MEEKNATKLDSLLDGHQQRRAADKQRAKEVLEEQKAYQEEFQRCLRDVVAPVCKQFAEKLTAKQYRAEVKGHRFSDGVEQLDPGVTLLVSVPGSPGASCISFSQGGLHTYVRNRQGGGSSSMSSYGPLEAGDRGKVEASILHFIENLLHQ